MDTTLNPPLEASRARRLKAATNDTHDRLDKRIMASEPFASVPNYARFLAVQYRFHSDIDALYGHEPLRVLLPDLAERRRLDQIRQDIEDLGQAVPESEGASPFASAAIDLPTALGWLYVAEGSNLGAAFLFKMARALGLDENHGARHLAGHPDGRARHWRAFTGALDALTLDDGEELRLAEGARTAFRRVHALVEST